MTVQERIKELMSERGYNISQLAKLSEISQPNMSNMLSGKYNPSYETLEKISKVFGVSIRDLFPYSKTEIIGFIEYFGSIYKIESTEDLEALLQKVKQDY